MKSKIICLAVLSVFLYSCASKSVATTATAEKSATTAELSKELTEGKHLYENNCAKCHKLFSPADYGKEAWKPILVKMQKKARLDNVQMASVSDYISSQL